MKMEKRKIYLSSTFIDMQTYRDEVINAIQKDSFNPYVELIHAETAVHESVSVWERTEADVKKCDYYFLLLGERYGSIYENEGVNPGRISYTEHEFNIAEKFGKKILVFCQNENATGTFIDRNEDNSINTDKQTKLKNLKQRAGTLPNYGPQRKFFNDTNDLIIQILHALFNLLFKGEGLIKSSSLHLFCDRSTQVDIFSNKRLNGAGFQSFIIRGDRNDLGKDLIKRFCLRELQLLGNPLPKEGLNLVEKTLDGNTIFLLSIFLEKIAKQRFAYNSVSEFLKAFENYSENQAVALCLDIEENMLGPQESQFLNYFIKTCSREVNASCKTSFYFFLNITETLPDKGFISFLEKVKNIFGNGNSKTLKNFLKQLKECDTKRLEKVSKKHVVDWMVSELGREQGEANMDFDHEFKDFINGSYSMEQVYGKLKAYSQKKY